jgi:hypothetical protein
MAVRYIPPSEVVSPRQHWSLIAVLHDGGPGDSALAIGRWDNQPVLAMRWNGNDKDSPIGNPQSRGLPTWFIVPDRHVKGTLEFLSKDKDKVALARNFFPNI